MWNTSSSHVAIRRPPDLYRLIQFLYSTADKATQAREVGLQMTPSQGPERGLYGISVAADLVGTGIQNLRAYERRGLLSPTRTEGGTRLYSDEDVARLRRITELLDHGLNLAGIAMVLDLEGETRRLRRRLDDG
jgi:hypothetical protein